MGTMKDCNSIRPLLSEYVDGVLSENQAWEVKMHLTTCSVCSKVADDFSATVRLLSALPQTQPSANFEAMLASRLADQVLKAKPKPFYLAWQEKMGEWWCLPGVGPAFASGAAVAAMLPIAFFAFHPTAPTPVMVSASPSVAASSSESDTLNELWQEHDVYASSVALGDHTGAISASADSSPAKF